MLANTKALLVIVSCALIAQAQSSGSSTTATAPASQSSLPAGLDTCILTCVTEAATSNGCASFTDLQCVCTSTAFQQASLACLQANCTAADLATATQLQSQECAALSSGSAPASTAAATAASSGTGSVSAASSGAPSASAASSGASSASASATPSATSTSAAMALSAPISFASLVGTLFASAGALVGAAFVL